LTLRGLRSGQRPAGERGCNGDATIATSLALVIDVSPG